MQTIRSELRGRHDRFGYVAENEVKDRTPVDEGLLRNSYTHDVSEDGETLVIGSPLNYSVFVELGTGVHATGEGGSRAKRIPWVYYSEKYGFITTWGNVAQPHLEPGVLAAAQRAAQIYGGK